VVEGRIVIAGEIEGCGFRQILENVADSFDSSSRGSSLIQVWTGGGIYWIAKELWTDAGDHLRRRLDCIARGTYRMLTVDEVSQRGAAESVAGAGRIELFDLGARHSCREGTLDHQRSFGALGDEQELTWACPRTIEVTEKSGCFATVTEENICQFERLSDHVQMVGDGLFERAAGGRKTETMEVANEVELESGIAQRATVYEPSG
jgi:hypothetical protein